MKSDQIFFVHMSVTFRIIFICLCLLVKYMASQYWKFNHGVWQTGNFWMRGIEFQDIFWSAFVCLSSDKKTITTAATTAAESKNVLKPFWSYAKPAWLWYSQIRTEHDKSWQNTPMSLDVLVSCTIITEDMPDKTFICGQEAVQCLMCWYCGIWHQNTENPW